MGSIETSFYNSGTVNHGSNVVLKCRINAPLDKKKALAAFTAIKESFPTLSNSIFFTKGDPALLSMGQQPKHEGLTYTTKSIQSIDNYLQKLVNAPISTGGGLAKVHLLTTQGEDKAFYFVLHVAHCLCDAQSGINVFQAFAAHYLYQTPPPHHPMLPNVEQYLVGYREPTFLLRYFTQKIARKMRKTFTGGTFNSLSAPQTKLLTRTFTTAQTEQLRVFCHQHKLKVTGLLGAALARAVQQVRAGQANNRVTISAAARIKAPAVATEGCGLMLYHILMEQDLSQHKTLVQLAAAIGSDITAGIQGKKFVLSHYRPTPSKVAFNKRSLIKSKSYRNSCYISNMGVIALDEGIAKQTDQLQYFTNVNQRGSVMIIYAATLHGQLSCTFGYAHPALSDEEAEAILAHFDEDIQQALRSMQAV